MNDSSFNSSARVRAIVEDTVEELAPWLMETDISILELRGNFGSGYYFSAIDKAPRSDEYKYLTQGAMAVDDLLLTFTVLTNEADSSIVKTALDVLRSARRET